jgi:hypothetical protein
MLYAKGEKKNGKWKIKMIRKGKDSKNGQQSK